MPKALVRLDDVSLGYEARAVLQHLGLTVEEGEFLALLGPNGAGKTTLLRGLLGLLPVLGGHIEYCFDRAASPPGYVPQRETLDPIFPLTALEVVLMGTYARLRPLRHAGRRERTRASSPGRSRASRGFSSSTSRPPASTRAPRRPSWTSSPA